MPRREIEALPIEGDPGFRERAIEPERACLLVIDLQKGLCDEAKRRAEPDDAYLWDRLDKAVVPNGKRLLEACRRARVEVIFTVIECLTLDGRDRSADHKISGIFFAKGSRGAEVIDALAPLEDEIVIPKTASGVFNATNLDYVLRNLGIAYVMAMGILTDQCVETAIRDGCDRGYLMTLIDDACAARTPEAHAASLRGLRGYCRARTTDQVIAELADGSASGTSDSR